jgi:hypothetical protein
MDGTLTRRSFLGATAAAVLASPADACSAAASHERLRLKLFPPTGPFPIGTVSLDLVDHSRRDPWVPSQPRELMVSVWYPASSTSGYGWAPWIPHAAGAVYLKQFVSSLQATSAGPSAGSAPGSSSLPGVSLPITRARQGAPAHLSARRYPVVLCQPGYGDIRATGTGLVSDLASRGYIVVTMDDTYEAEVVEFPDGRLAIPRPGQNHVGPARLADTRFVLDELVRLQSGANPDALHRKLPTGLSNIVTTADTYTSVPARAAHRAARATVDVITKAARAAPGSRRSGTAVTHMSAAVSASGYCQM